MLNLERKDEHFIIDTTIDLSKHFKLVGSSYLRAMEKQHNFHSLCMAYVRKVFIAWPLMLAYTSALSCGLGTLA